MCVYRVDADVVAITGINVWGNFSWEKWYQDQQFWFCSCFLGHIFWGNVEAPKCFLFSLNEGCINAISARIVVSSNPINLINAHSLHYKPVREQSALIKLNGLLLAAVASRHGIHSRVVKAERENFGIRHCLTKCPLENKPLNQIADLGIIFLRRSYLIHWY